MALARRDFDPSDSPYRSSRAACKLPGFETSVRHLLATPLETRFKNASLSGGADIAGIIVLGGGHERIYATAELFRRIGDIQVVASGFTASEIEVLVANGVARERVLHERKSTTTYENAAYAKALVNPSPCERWLLVTSAHHMVRALATFRTMGFRVEPWLVYGAAAHRPLNLTESLHEWGGLLAYRILGRTDAFFPGPSDHKDLVQPSCSTEPGI